MQYDGGEEKRTGVVTILRQSTLQAVTRSFKSLNYSVRYWRPLPIDRCHQIEITFGCRHPKQPLLVVPQCALPRHFWNWNHSRQKRIEGESAQLLTAADTIVTPCSSTTSTVLHVCLISITRHFEEDEGGKKGQQFFLSQWHFPSRAQGREAHVNSLTRRIDWKSHHCEFKTQRSRQVTQRGWRRFFLPFLLIFSTRNATLDQSKYSTDSSSPRVCTFIAAPSSLLSYPIPPSPWQCLKFRTSLHHVRTLATSSLFLFHVCSCSLVFSFCSFLSLFNHHF